MATKRIADEPAYVLHRYDWSETSLILEVFTRQHGRVALAAKGVKRPTSSFRPVLLPLQPLSITYGGEGDVRTLKGAEWVGGHVMPTGEALLSGYYLNELLMRLLVRDDPHPRLFEVYAAAVRLLAKMPTIAARAFTPARIVLSVVMSPVPTSSDSAYLTSGSATASSSGGSSSSSRLERSL